MGYEKRHSRLKKIPFGLAVLGLFFFVFTTPVHAATLSKPSNNLGLVGYWSFDEGAGTIAHDFSGNGNKGTLAGTALPTWVSGKHAGALSFTPSGRVNVASNTSLDSSTFTISMWINPLSLDQSNGAFTNGIMERESYQVSGFRYALKPSGASNAYPNFWTTQSGGTIGMTASTTIPVGSFSHVVITYDGSTARFYINGILSGTYSGTYVVPTGVTLYLNGGNFTFSTSIMDDIRIYSRALSATEILALYSAGSVLSNAANENGLVGHWTFDEGSGNIAHDSSGNGNNGVLYSTSWGAGKFGAAATFADSGSSYINVPSATSLNVGSAFTYSIWLRRSGVSTSQWPYYLAAGGDSHRYYGIRDYAWGATVVFEYSNPPYDGTSYSSIPCGGSGNLPLHEWHLYTVTYDGSTLKCYRDAVYSGQTTGVTLNTASVQVRMGQAFNGQADDARIYNRALSATEVAQLYGSTAAKINDSRNTRLTGGLVGLWSFDGADFTDKVYDRSGNGNNGYFTSGATSTAKIIGKIGQGVFFDGTRFVSVPDSSSLQFGTSSFTLSLWMQFPVGTVNPYWSFGKGNGYSGTGFGIAHWTTNDPISPGLFVDDGTLICSPSCGKSVYGAFSARGIWTHYVFVVDRNANVIKAYTNGVAGNSTSIAGLGSFDSSSALEIGGMAGNKYNGYLDDVRIYNRALSDSEIKQLYNMGK